jgi:hypothetical protein
LFLNLRWHAMTPAAILMEASGGRQSDDNVRWFGRFRKRGRNSKRRKDRPQPGQ